MGGRPERGKSCKPSTPEVSNRLPFQHRDPFDRMIIAQAIAENVPVISYD